MTRRWGRRRGHDGVGGRGEGGRARVERRGERGHGGPQAEDVDPPGVDAAEERVDEAVGQLVAEAGPQQRAERRVAARRPGQRAGGLGRRRREPGVRQQPGQPGPARRHAQHRAAGQRHRAPRRADRRARRRRVDEPFDQPELGQQRLHLGPPREERLGADVVGPAREVDGAQDAADAVALLQQRDRGLGAEQRAQAVGSGQTRDARPDHRDPGCAHPLHAVHELDQPREDVRVGLGQHAVAQVEHVAGRVAAVVEDAAHLGLDRGPVGEQHGRVEVALHRARRCGGRPRPAAPASRRRRRRRPPPPSPRAARRCPRRSGSAAPRRRRRPRARGWSAAGRTGGSRARTGRPPRSRRAARRRPRPRSAPAGTWP